jgi:hypothetical protein
MDVPWKVILAFVGVFIAGAVFGGVFTMGVSARRFANPRNQGPVERPIAQFPAVTPPRSEFAGPQVPKGAPVAQVRSNPITPVLMNQFMRKISGLTDVQKESMRKTLGRAGEDLHRLRQDNFSDVARVTERMYADVSAVLTIEQRAELETMRKQMEERLQAEGKKRKEAAAAEAALRASNAPTATPVKNQGTP